LNVKNPLGDFTNPIENLHNNAVTRLFNIDETWEGGTKDGIIGKDARTFEDTKSKGFEIAVKDPNQIKSSTDNVGTFSRENNDIRYNKDAKQYYDYLRTLAEKEVIRDKTISLKDFNQKYGTNLKYKDKTATSFRERQKETLYGIDVKHAKDKPVFAQKIIDRATLLNYLNDKFGLAVVILSNEEYSKRISDKRSNCFVENDTMYIRERSLKNLTNEQFIEEFLHPTVHDVYKHNKSLSTKLLKEAKKDFSELCSHIEKLYEQEGQDVINEEIITQVLAKYLNKEISDNGLNTRNIVNYIKNFIAEIFKRFVDLFGEIDENAIRNHNRFNIRGRYIKDVLNYREFAELINSKNANFAYPLEKGIVRNNKTSEEFYTKQSVDDYVRDLIAVDNIRKENIKVTHYPETEDTDEYWIVSYTPQQSEANTVSNLNSFINHSGGAIGSDSYWGEVGERYGVKSNHYYHGNKTPKGNVEITEEEFEEGKQHVLKANETLNRKPNSYMDLLARNWMQVKNADAIFAIGHLKKGIVDGGTGWAVQMAIDVNKPVYVFDQERNQWYKNINGVWSESEIPTLTPNFAGIGTRQLNDDGKKAIEEVYRKTFETQ
jgi:hypothetical protein